MSRYLAIILASACWLLYVSAATKLRSVLAALAYSLTEFGFTRFLERGGEGYTSAAQLFANVLYAGPILIDGYATLLPPHEQPLLYILAFPLNIWLYEGLLGSALVWVYGKNIAWRYDDYADAFCSSHCRLGHAPFWWGLGVVCLFVCPALNVATEAAVAACSCSCRA